MPDAVTLQVDRHRKTGDVGGKHLDMNGQGGDPPPVAHRSDPQIIDAFEYLGFQFDDLRIRVRITHPAQKGLLRQQHAFFRRPPYADTNDNGRTGIGACLIDTLHDKIDDARSPLGRWHHGDSTHVLTAESFGERRNFQLLARHNGGMDDRRRIVLRVDSRGKRSVHNRFAQVSLGIRATRPLLNCLVQITTDNMHVLAQLQKNNRHARILA